MADQKVTALGAVTPVATDILYLVDDPGGTPVSAKATAASVLDLLLKGAGTNTLEQRNSTNAQTFNLYNTYTDASNYERGFLKWNSNVLEIGTGAAGTGTQRQMAISSINLNLSQPSNGQLLSISRAGEARIALRVDSSNNVAIEGNASNGAIEIKESGVSVANARTNRFEFLLPPQINASSTVAALPGTPLVGMIARVTDADTPAVGSTVTGGGAAAALVWYNGTNWTVIGV